MSTLLLKLADFLPARIGTRLRGSESARRVGANVAWLGVDKVYSTAVALVVSIFVARYLGRADFGLFSYTLAFVMLFKVLGDVGLEELLVRDLVKYPEARNEILGTAFFMRLAGGLVTMAIVAAAVRWVRPDDPTARLLVMITSVLYIPQAGMLVCRWYNARLQAKYNVVASNVALTVISAVRLLLVYAHAPLIWFVWTNVGMILVNAVVLLALYTATGESPRRWRFRWQWFRQLLGDAWPQIPNGLAAAVVTQTGALMIGNMLGDDQLGSYAIAFRFYSLLLVVPDIVSQSLVPTLTTLRVADPARFENRMAQSYRLMFALYLGTLIPVFVLGLGGIELLYGHQYAGAGRLIMLFAVPIFFVYMGQLRMWFIIIENRIRYMMHVALAQAAVSMAANYLLIRWLGAAGAILGMAVGAAFILVADAFFAPARRNCAIMLKGIFALPLSGALSHANPADRPDVY